MFIKENLVGNAQCFKNWLIVIVVAAKEFALPGLAAAQYVTGTLQGTVLDKNGDGNEFRV